MIDYEKLDNEFNQQLETVNNYELFERMKRTALVKSITFSEFMVKIKHLDRSWAK